VICPKCKTDHAHRSHRGGLKDYAFGIFQYFPYRCKECGFRFFEPRYRPPKSTEKPSSTETEIRATRAGYRWKQKRREFLIYGAAILVFLVFIYFLTRDRGAPSGPE
jgi:hypothetical protein